MHFVQGCGDVSEAYDVDVLEVLVLDDVPEVAVAPVQVPPHVSDGHTGRVAWNKGRERG